MRNNWLRFSRNGYTSQHVCVCVEHMTRLETLRNYTNGDPELVLRKTRFCYFCCSFESSHNKRFTAPLLLRRMRDVIVSSKRPCGRHSGHVLSAVVTLVARV